MRKMMFAVVIITFLICITRFSNAQTFSKAGKLRIDPLQVIPENYSVIRIKEFPEMGVKMNVFSRDNPHTVLQLIADEKMRVYHILYQTTFTGKPVYIGCSNNLYALFSRKEKPMHLFNNCMEALQEEISSVRIMEKSIDCILERLAYALR